MKCTQFHVFAMISILVGCTTPIPTGEINEKEPESTSLDGGAHQSSSTSIPIMIRAPKKISISMAECGVMSFALIGIIKSLQDQGIEVDTYWVDEAGALSAHLALSSLTLSEAEWRVFEIRATQLDGTELEKFVNHLEQDDNLKHSLRVKKISNQNRIMTLEKISASHHRYHFDCIMGSSQGRGGVSDVLKRQSYRTFKLVSKDVKWDDYSKKDQMIQVGVQWMEDHKNDWNEIKNWLETQ